MTVRDYLLEKRSERTKSLALESGFDACGISVAGFLEEEAPRLERWLSKGMHGNMDWMARHFDKRLDPRQLVPGAKAIISVVLNYFPKELLPENEGNYKISKYAYGSDYHQVLKEKLKSLMSLMRAEFGEINGRAFVDSAPVMDKAWAKKAGLGWVGKNTNLINPKTGSFFFIGELIVDLELAPDHADKDHCGTCTRCVDACPTDAITEPYVVDGSKCISYYTIELKEAIPEEAKGKLQDWIFGCDICQDVCPWNRFAEPGNSREFELGEPLKNFTRNDWEEITEEVFGELFRHSAIKRTKLNGLKRNIEFVAKT